MPTIIPEATGAAAWKEIAEERERTNEALHRELDDMTERCRTAEQRVRAAAPPTPVQEHSAVDLVRELLPLAINDGPGGCDGTDHKSCAKCAVIKRAKVLIAEDHGAQ
jgi:hypothetical protein